MMALRQRVVRIGQAAALATALIWAYAPALTGGWIWDDGNEVVANPALRGRWRALAGIWLGKSGPDYFPLKTSLQWAEWRIFGLSPFGYHAVNLTLHFLAALLLWRILVRMGLAAVSAWFGALLFAVHPVAVESVAWIAELKNALSLPLLLLSANAWLAAEAEPPNAAPARRSYLASLGWYLAAALAKTTVVMFPVWLLLYGWTRRGRLSWRARKATAPFFAISAGLGAAAVFFQQHRALQDQAVAVAAWPERVGQAGRAALYYLARCAWPARSGPAFLDWNGTGWEWPAAALAGSALFVVLSWRRRVEWGRVGLLAFGWFGLNLLPVLGMVPMSYARLSPVADHFAYLSLLGVAGAAAAGLGAAVRRCRTWPVRSGLAGLAGLIFLLLTVASRTQAGAFRSETAFWEAALRRNSGAWIADSNLGLALLGEGRLQEAELHLRAAALHGSNVPDTHNNHGKALGALGRPDEAIAEFRAALALEPRFVDARINLGTALVASGREADGLAQYDQALSLRPGSAAVQCDRGLALEQMGRAAEAADAYRAATRAQPGEAEPHYRLGNLLANSGRLDDAMTEYRIAVKLRPEYAEAAANWGLALALAHRTADAIQLLQSVVRARPGYPEAHAYLGLALAQAGRQAEAAGEYATALRGAPGNSDLHYQFALTLQTLGRTADAQREFEAAQNLTHPR